MSSQISAVFSAFLAGAAGYACLKITPDHPYAFTACALICCHGIMGVAADLFVCDPNSRRCLKFKSISASIIETAPLPLINIQLYLNSTQNDALAMGHCLFIIPTVYDVYAKIFHDNQEDNATETLKDLNALGNIVSLVFLAVNENRFVYGAMAFVAFLTKYGSWLLDSLYEGTEQNCVMFGDAVFCMLVAKALTMDNNAEV